MFFSVVFAGPIRLFIAKNIYYIFHNVSRICILWQKFAAKFTQIGPLLHEL